MGPDELTEKELMVAMHARVQEKLDRQQGPEVADQIPLALYQKARYHQDQLTDTERQLLLSRGDVVGKALAYPSSLTEVERNRVLGWPSPDVVRANIERVTNGELSTAGELFAKAHMDFNSLTEAEKDLLGHNFFAENVTVLDSSFSVAGNTDASELLQSADEKEVIMKAIRHRVDKVKRRSDRSKLIAKETEERRRKEDEIRRREMEYRAQKEKAITDKIEELKQRTALKKEDRDQQINKHNEEMRKLRGIVEKPLPREGDIPYNYYPPNFCSARGPRDAYSFYVNDVRAKLVEEHRDAPYGTVSRIMEQQWSAMSDAEKAPWTELAELHKDDYLKVRAGTWNP